MSSRHTLKFLSYGTALAVSLSVASVTVATAEETTGQSAVTSHIEFGNEVVQLAQTTVAQGGNLDLTLKNIPPSDIGAYVFQIDGGTIRLPFEQPQKDFAEVDAGMLDLYYQFFKDGAGTLSIALPADISAGQHTLTMVNSLEDNPSFKKDLTFNVTGTVTPASPTSEPVNTAPTTPVESTPTYAIQNKFAVVNHKVHSGELLYLKGEGFAPRGESGYFAFKINRGSIPFVEMGGDITDLDSGAAIVSKHLPDSATGSWTAAIMLPRDLKPGKYTINLLAGNDRVGPKLSVSDEVEVVAAEETSAPVTSVPATTTTAAAASTFAVTQPTAATSTVEEPAAKEETSANNDAAILGQLATIKALSIASLVVSILGFFLSLGTVVPSVMALLNGLLH